MGQKGKKIQKANGLSKKHPFIGTTWTGFLSLSRKYSKRYCQNLFLKARNFNLERVSRYYKESVSINSAQSFPELSKHLPTGRCLGRSAGLEQTQSKGKSYRFRPYLAFTR
ncbi:hypothetical protein LEP1GSC086_3513 [Leptospira weilii str. LNT 1234]|nr:hypothetical protein LEP1GSC086_3513 [Leptospira weilii str. LNT 1234]